MFFVVLGAGQQRSDVSSAASALGTQCIVLAMLNYPWDRARWRGSGSRRVVTVGAAWVARLSRSMREVAPLVSLFRCLRACAGRES